MRAVGAIFLAQYVQVAQLSQRDRSARCVSFGQKWKTVTWETIFYGRYRSIFNHCDIISLQICRIRCKNAKYGRLRRSRSFKVIEVGTNRKPVCDWLKVTDIFLSRTVLELSQLLLLNLDTLRLWAPFRRLRDNVPCSS